MFQFIPLLGAQSEDRASASLLLLDNGIKILVDCGWSDPFDIKDLAQIQEHTPTIDLVLLTHPTISHLGAYAHCCAHVPLFSQIPVYCTYPVANLGRTLLQDAYLSQPLIHTFMPTSTPFIKSENNGDDNIKIEQDNDSSLSNVLLQPPSPEDIDRYFDAMHPLKYSQPFQFQAPLTGLTVTAYRAGHTLGGTIWRIQHLQENILYSVDWNHSRDAHLSSAALLPSTTGMGGGRVPEEFLKPTAMVCSSRNAIPSTMTVPRRRRDELLLSTLRKVAFKDGIALIPTDSSARVLELVYLLEHDYRKNESGWHNSGASVVLACKTAGRTLRYAKSLLEWMDDSMIREFESTDTGNENKRGGQGRYQQRNQQNNQQQQQQNFGPFDLRHVKLVEKRKQLMKMLRGKGGKVIIASDNSLEWGFSRDVLEYIAGDPNNLVVLTERMDGAEHSDVGSTLWKKWKAIAEDMDNEMGAMHPMDGSDWELQKRKRMPLTPAELVAHQQNLIAQQAHLATNLPGQSATADAQAAGGDESSESSSSESDDDDDDDPKQGKALMSTHHANPMRKLLGVGGVEDLGVNVLIKGKGIYDFDVRGAKGRNRMFPFAVPRRKGDEYGEVVRAEDYLRAEEREDVIGNDPTGTGGEKLEIVGFGGGGLAGIQGQDSAKENSRVFGRKRKWDNVNIGGSNHHHHRHNQRGGPAGGRRQPYYHNQNSHGNNQNSNNNSPAGKRRRRNTRGGYTRGDMPRKEEEESASESEESESSDEEDALLYDFTTPCKLVTTTTKLQLNLYVTFIDFEGLHDARSLRMLLPLINPRKLILVGGTEAETRSLSEDVSNSASSSGLEIEVFSPKAGVTLNASVDTNAWTVKLSEKLVKSLKWQEVRGMGVVHVVGKLVEETDGEGDEAMADNERRNNNNLVLDVAPVNSAGRGGAAIHVGDIRLADLRRVLLEGGHTAEFRGEGTLLCDGVVVIRKEGVGKISVEDTGGGLLSGIGLRTRGAGIGKKGFGRFWEVRQRVYEGLAVVSGGAMG